MPRPSPVDGMLVLAYACLQSEMSDQRTRVAPVLEEEAPLAASPRSAGDPVEQDAAAGRAKERRQHMPRTAGSPTSRPRRGAQHPPASLPAAELAGYGQPALPLAAPVAGSVPAPLPAGGVPKICSQCGIGECAWGARNYACCPADVGCWVDVIVPRIRPGCQTTTANTKHRLLHLHREPLFACSFVCQTVVSCRIIICVPHCWVPCRWLQPIHPCGARSMA